MRLRQLFKMHGPNCGDRTLFESVMVPEIVKALKDLRKSNLNGVIIGGLALSYYVKPRHTDDIDFLFADPGDCPTEISSFKRTRDQAFIHKSTRVELEVLDPAFLKMPPELVRIVLATANVIDGMRVASPGGIIAMKMGRLNARDRADIIDLIKSVPDQIDMSQFPMSDTHRGIFEQLKVEAANDPT